ncbi:Gfo/Idh/MocA family protein [Mucilaginibacter calamicampi]|uniref:Gfo/Idh/MocA family protein n=1 Tax=Mucilaginibacter calamicampi TaxID=1302352 RepID=A0ABW2YUV8_9SPHI
MEVLIIGLGSIAYKHILALKSITSDITLYALRNAGNETVEGVTNIYNLAALNTTPDFVIISNPTNLHYDAILSVMHLGVPLFIEKPPLHELSASEALIARLNQSQIPTYVACNLRFHPCIKFLKSYFENNEALVNEVNVYCGSYLPGWRPTKNYKDVYSAHKEMGGGVHLDLFHELDYAIWLFGPPEKHRGYTSNKSTLNISAIDCANYIFEYKNFNIFIVLNYYRVTAKRTIEILFQDQTWEVDLLRATIKSDTHGLIFEHSTYNILDTYKEQMEYFFQNVLPNGESMNTFEDSIQTLKISVNG